MSEPRRWSFGPFEADAREQRLWCGERPVPVTRKSFALLVALLDQAGKLVTKDELFGTVWAHRTVTDSALSRAIRELRVALEDDASAPRYIETVHGLGFRFLAPVSHPVGARNAGVSAPTSTMPDAETFVGRDDELARLDTAWAVAHGGRRQLVFVTGEPGIGKTQLVECFIARQRERRDLCWAQGRCIEQYGTREAYLPILEALEQLAGQLGAETLRQTLARYAPAWLAQLPWLAHDTDTAALKRAVADSTAQRMLRELAQALEVLATTRTIVLWLEDLHWSDHASLAVVAFLAGRRDPARLMVIASYRPSDALARDTPLLRIAHDLALHQQCQMLPLQRLNARVVADYIRIRFEASPALRIEDFAAFIHSRTDGNALFTVAMVDDLVRRGELMRTAQGWQLRCPIDELRTDLPENLRQLIRGQFERLNDGEKHLLQAAATVGNDFSSVAVAAALHIDALDAETACSELAHNGRFIRVGAAVVWPDGTETETYSFLHAMYWQVLYEQVPESRRAAWHLRIALRQEQAYGAQADQIAVELAMHFEGGRDIARCIHYLQRAGTAALARCAYLECVALLRNALDLVPRLVAEQRQRCELDLLLPLGAALMASQGYASTEVEACYQRALALCRICAQPGELVRGLRGLWNVALVGARLDKAQALADELLAHAKAGTGAPGGAGQAFDAHAKLGQTAMHRGDFAGARQHLEHALALLTPTGDKPPPRESPRVAGYLAWVLWYTGHPDRARQRADEALELARLAASAHSSAFALAFVSWLYLFRGETAQAQPLARQQLALCVEHGLSYWHVWSEFTLGLADVRLGAAQRGLPAMREALTAYMATAEVGVAHFNNIYAQACLDAGDIVAARAALRDATASIERTGNALDAAETLRLEGELAWAESAIGAPAEAQECFQRALDLARRQGARALELRAATSLSRLWQRGGQRERGIALIGPLCAHFTEGADTVDVREARSLLVALRRS